MSYPFRLEELQMPLPLRTRTGDERSVVDLEKQVNRGRDGRDRRVLCEKGETMTLETLTAFKQPVVKVYSSYAIVTTFLAGIEATLLTGTPPLAPRRPTIQRLNVFLTFVALIMNISATVSAVYAIQLTEALAAQALEGASGTASAWDVDHERWRIRRGMRMLWAASDIGFVDLHWLTSFRIGACCIFGQITAYVWMIEPVGWAAALSVVVVVGALPLGALLVRRALVVVGGASGEGTSPYAVMLRLTAR